MNVQPKLPLSGHSERMDEKHLKAGCHAPLATTHKFSSPLVFGGWAVWVLFSLMALAADPVWRGRGSLTAWVAAVGAPMSVAAGAVLAWRLYDSFSRGLCVAFLLWSAFLLWKFQIGGIVMFMLPEMGGYSLGESLGLWWTRRTLSLFSFVSSLPPLLVLLASFTFWPILCLSRGEKKVA
jgi:hypothetical protein